MIFRLAILSLALCALSVSAQSDKKDPKKPEKAPQGYTRKEYYGFTVYLNDDVEKENQNQDRKLKKKPLDALDMELKRVDTILKGLKVNKEFYRGKPDPITTLRHVPIWVEWDEHFRLENGRTGGAVAVFYGGTRANLLTTESNKVKNEAITILSLKSLAEEHQPGTDAGRCVILHELGHAFHHYVVGDGNLEVKTTFDLAMKDGQYKKVLYATTNAHEYFAELTCCYLAEQLDYIPHTRDELSKVDKRGYDLMAKYWGKLSVQPASPPSAKGTMRATPTDDDLLPIASSTDELVLGKAAVGVLPAKKGWKGRPVLAVLFSAGNVQGLVELKRLNDLYTELSDFGLVAFGTENRAESDVLKKLAWKHDITFPLLSGTDFGIKDAIRLPYAIVYDHEGKCVFSGSTLAVESKVRIAVGNAVVAQVKKGTFSKQAQPVVEMLRGGKRMKDVFLKIGSAPADDDLKELRNALMAQIQQALDPKRTKDFPRETYFVAKRLSETYRGTTIGVDASNIVDKLSSSKEVQDEKDGQKKLSEIQKVEEGLRIQPNSFNPEAEAFKRENKKKLDELQSKIQDLRRRLPNTRAAEQAARIADFWGVKADK